MINQPSTTPDEPAAPLEAVDVRVELGGLPILRGVSISVHSGEAVALLGSNGSGKSTFLRACLGLTQVHSGSVSWFGTGLSRFRQWQRIGYVPQRSVTGLRGATVQEIVATGRLSLRPPFVPTRRSDREAVRHALRQVQLDDRRGAEFSTLSGGQQQRVLIARALVAGPDALVLDEPTAGVDLEHQQVLADIIGTLMADGHSMLVVLHELGPLRPLINRAVTLRAGRVIADGALAADDQGHHHDHDHQDTGGLLPGHLIGPTGDGHA
ncbi:metal ABC transporter ATP-binding protein [Propionibacteriaceae bacterium Y1685]|uniref:metal ABC transporter ATP-binding protein n=1 Tax=Microlunatus sp. Y1700 TaxID=3418487 RepID=UPI003B7B21DD